MSWIRRVAHVLGEGFAGLDSTRQVLIGYLLYIIVGFGVLVLPWCHEEGLDTGLIDHFFSAVSAVSTTGLVTIATGDSYALPGEIAILVMIQLGGIGYMTAGSFFMLARTRSLSGVRESVGKVVFSLPEGYSARALIRGAVAFSLTIETLGAIGLYFAFKDGGSTQPLWDAIFHSISAFCTAGFSLNGDSLEGYQTHLGVNLIISVLSLLGAIGFIVMVDLFRRCTHRCAHSTLTTKIILIATFGLIALGTVVMYFAEPAIRELSPSDRLMSAFFQSMTASTTVGFNTVSIGALSYATLVIMFLLMIVGASPSGTGGGLKVTTFTAMLAMTWATLRSSVHVTFMRKEIPRERLQASAANLSMYLSTFMLGLFLIMLTETGDFEDLSFEVASALGTVGLSRGVTGELTPIGKVIICGLMYAGRVGPIVLGLGMLANLRAIEVRPVEEEDLAT